MYYHSIGIQKTVPKKPNTLKYNQRGKQGMNAGMGHCASDLLPKDEELEIKVLKSDLEILKECINGVKYSNGKILDENNYIKSKCDPRSIRSLKDCGYLRCGITVDLFDTVKTTKEGRMYIDYLSELDKLKKEKEPHFFYKIFLTSKLK